MWELFHFSQVFFFFWDLTPSFKILILLKNQTLMNFMLGRKLIFFYNDFLRKWFFPYSATFFVYKMKIPKKWQIPLHSISIYQKKVETKIIKIEKYIDGEQILTISVKCKTVDGSFNSNLGLFESPTSWFLMPLLKFSLLKWSWQTVAYFVTLAPSLLQAADQKSS